MPRKAVVASDIQTALLYAHSFDLDSEEWGFYGSNGNCPGPFDRIVWLCDENGFQNERRSHYHNWITRLGPNGQLLILSIR